ncbi:ABC transporter ATP-binding protein [Rhodobacter sp. 24-YEA-8]|uniref:ABC transporter ATP-binding protein n=1 Tax=Rhodobacter sp. 24-YEA-8 TaxID=1884310 RepID=UPI00089A5BB5|nr:ABC transporter ATP-binding protein [Rhodobacter sp. 24-YEA-8]SED64397.1 amino acid/amide ABC transporter ATP-binding protein 2, HAAT family [Rhodobacter sp. 24-YEA-8]
MNSMLRLEQVSVRYGPVRAVTDLDLRAGEGEVIALLGPNGAGKSSTIGAINGLVPASGRISLGGRDISSLAVEARIAGGIAVAPEGRRIFVNLTVAENLRLGAALRRDPAGIRADTERYLALFPVLGERSNQPAGTLSGGEQQMLAIARAMMSRPKVLLLDEPSLGLAPMIVTRIFDFIGQLKSEGLTVILVEQNAAQAMRVADQVCVLVSGRISYRGTPADLAGTDVMKLYLGGAA